MPTDLETSIREALQARADAVVPRQTELRGQRGHRWMPPTLAAAAVIVLALIVSLVVTRRSDDTTGPAAGSPAATAVGYRWQLVRVVGPHAGLDVPSRLRATLDFQPGGHLQGDDTVNALGSTYRLDAQGFRLVADSMSTLVGMGPGDRQREVVVAAIGAVFYQRGSSHPEIPATVQGNVLTLHARGYTLTLQRGHAVVDDVTPSPTSTRSR